MRERDKQKTDRQKTDRQKTDRDKNIISHFSIQTQTLNFSISNCTSRYKKIDKRMQKGRIDNKLSSYYWILHTIYKTGEPLVSTSWPNKKNLYYNDSILYLNTIS